MSQENKTIVRRYYEEAWNQRKLAVVDELLATDYVSHHPGGELHGSNKMKEHHIEFRAGFPDVHDTIEDLIAEGDRVVIRITRTCTNTGEWMGIAPTGKRVSTSQMFIHRIAGGKMVETWGFFDRQEVREQLSA